MPMVLPFGSTMVHACLKMHVMPPPLPELADGKQLALEAVDVEDAAAPRRRVELFAVGNLDRQ